MIRIVQLPNGTLEQIERLWWLTAGFMLDLGVYVPPLIVRDRLELVGAITRGVSAGGRLARAVAADAAICRSILVEVDL